MHSCLHAGPNTRLRQQVTVVVSHLHVRISRGQKEQSVGLTGRGKKCSTPQTVSADLHSLLNMIFPDNCLCVLAALQVCFVVEKRLMAFVCVPPQCCMQTIYPCFHVEKSMNCLLQSPEVNFVGKWQIMVQHLCILTATNRETTICVH